MLVIALRVDPVLCSQPDAKDAGGGGVHGKPAAMLNVAHDTAAGGGGAGHSRHVSDQSKLSSSSYASTGPGTTGISSAVPAHVRQSSADATLIYRHHRYAHCAQDHLRPNSFLITNGNLFEAKRCTTTVLCVYIWLLYFVNFFDVIPCHNVDTVTLVCSISLGCFKKYLQSLHLQVCEQWFF